MSLSKYLSCYVLNMIEIEEFPTIAIKLLEEGYDTPSLRILSSLNENGWEIDEYLKKTLKELDINMPTEVEAILFLVKGYIDQIINKSIDPINGLEKIFSNVVDKTNFDYEDVGLKELKLLSYKYWEYYEHFHPIIFKKRRNKLMNKIEVEIIMECKKYISDIQKIKSHNIRYLKR